MQLEFLTFWFVTFCLGIGGLRYGAQGHPFASILFVGLYGASVVGLVVLVWLGLCPSGGLGDWGLLGSVWGGAHLPLSLVRG